MERCVIIDSYIGDGKGLSVGEIPLVLIALDRARADPLKETRRNLFGHPDNKVTTTPAVPGRFESQASQQSSEPYHFGFGKPTGGKFDRALLNVAVTKVPVDN